MTYRVNALSQIFVIIMASSMMLGGASRAIASDVSDEEKVEVKNSSSENKLEISENSKSKSSEKILAGDALRRIQVLQTPPLNFSFKFSKFKTQWLLSENDWKNFWASNSRINGAAPALPLNWKAESILAIFWEGKDDVVRIPAFQASEVVQSEHGTQLRLIFNLNSPCFGIITDESPVQFIVFDHNYSDIDSIVVRTEKTRSVGCF